MKTFHRELRALQARLMISRFTQFRRDRALTQLTFSRMSRSKMSSKLLKIALLTMEMILKGQKMDHPSWPSCLCLKAYLACRKVISMTCLNKRLQTCHMSFTVTHLVIRWPIPARSSTQRKNTLSLMITNRRARPNFCHSPNDTDQHLKDRLKCPLSYCSSKIQERVNTKCE